MATPNNFEKRWAVVEEIRAVNSLDVRFRIAVRALDGWVHVMDITNAGYVATVPPTRRRVLEDIQRNITMQLAELTLEEK
jgi:hypothetical protein